MTGKGLKDYICEETKKVVDPTSLDSFIHDVLEDLEFLDQSRIVIKMS